MHQLERHRLERLGLHGHLGQIDQLQTELLGQSGQDVRFLGEAALDEQLVHRLAGRCLLSISHAAEDVLRKDSLLYQSLHQMHTVLSSGSIARSA